MKNLIITILLLVFPGSGIAWACEVCQERQPKMLQNISHGTGPEGNWDYIIIWLAAVMVTITLFYSLKFLIRPREKGSKHIKNIVIDQLV